MCFSKYSPVILIQRFNNHTSKSIALDYILSLKSDFSRFMAVTTAQVSLTSERLPTTLLYPHLHPQAQWREPYAAIVISTTFGWDSLEQGLLPLAAYYNHVESLQPSWCAGCTLGHLSQMSGWLSARGFWKLALRFQCVAGQGTTTLDPLHCLPFKSPPPGFHPMPSIWMFPFEHFCLGSFSRFPGFLVMLPDPLSPLTWLYLALMSYPPTSLLEFARHNTVAFW